MTAIFFNIDPDDWGHRCPFIEPADLINEFAAAVRRGLDDWSFVPFRPEECDDKPGYFRISFDVPVPPVLFDQFFSGRTGYRAQYAYSVTGGRQFNNALIAAIAPTVLEHAERFAGDDLDVEFVRQSLTGPHSKFWFPKSLTTPGRLDHVPGLNRTIRWQRWREYWDGLAGPPKGLLTPRPDPATVLVNGTFVDLVTGAAFDQKPTRDQDLHDRGWT